MKRFIAIFIVALTILACQKKEDNFILTGNIKNLKKGTLYLQRKLDTTLITIDSTTIRGDANYTLSADIEEPEALYLRLNKNDDDDGIIRFFADKGTTTINSSLDNFLFDAEIIGSELQNTLEEYQLMMSRFNGKNLDLIKESFEKRAESDSLSNFDMQNQFDNLLKRKYLYTINFAINHKDSEIAPFLAVEEIADARTQFLDTIYNSLDDKIKISKYGKELKQLLNQRTKEQ